jgi:cell wall-associated NlpC family hydrolase
VTEGLATIQARISQIQSLVGGVSSAPTAATTAAAPTSSSGTTSTSFDDVLSKSAPAITSSVVGQQAVEIAKKYLGVQYRWGGTDPSTGLDCSGLTQLVYGQLGVPLPRVAADQARSGQKVASLADAKPGDLVFFGSPVHHVGIYIGDGKMLDAPHTGAKVQIREVYETPSAIRRVTASATANGSGSNLGLSSSGLDSAALLASLGLPASTPVSSLGSSTATGGLAGTPYADLFTAAGQRYGIDPALLSAVAKTESSYQASAVSPAGARGLMQLMPGTARSLGVNPDVPAQAVDGAARLLSDHLRTFNGRVDLALAAYNAGPGAVRKYGGVPPYPETRNYVQRVTTNWGELR